MTLGNLLKNWIKSGADFDSEIIIESESGNFEIVTPVVHDQTAFGRMLNRPGLVIRRKENDAS